MIIAKMRTLLNALLDQFERRSVLDFGDQLDALIRVIQNSPGSAGSVNDNLAGTTPEDVPSAPPGGSGETGQWEAVPPDPPSWFYASHCDAENWDGPCASRDEAIAEAFSGSSDPDDACYVVLGQRPTTVQLAHGISIEWILDQVIDYASDNHLISDDHELVFRDKALCEKELQSVLARHLVRPAWWVCDGQAAERIEKKDVVQP